jgi:hypothetical protein
VCAYCCQFCSSEKAFVLSNTDNTKYCSERCITLDYLVHSHEVDALRSVDSIRGSDACRLVVRVAATRKYENLKGVIRGKKKILQEHPTIGRENIYSEVKTLQPESSFVPEDSKAIIRETSGALAQIATQHKLPLNAADAEHFIYAIHSNAHQILDKNDSLLGVGLFPFTSMMNHSCSPNCFHTFSVSGDNKAASGVPRLVMRTLKDVAAGEELCYSYVRLYQTTEARREVLSKVYSFICNCKRCSNGGLAAEPTTSDQDSSVVIDDSVIGREDLSDLDAIIPDHVGLEKDDRSLIVDNVTETLELFRTKLETLDNNETFNELMQMLFNHESEHFMSLINAEIHPSHIVLFKVYISLSRYVAQRLSASLITKSKELSQHHALAISSRDLLATIALGLLALGSIHLFTNTRQLEVARIEEELRAVVAEAAKCVGAQISEETNSSLEAVDSSITANTSALLAALFGADLDVITDTSTADVSSPWLSGFAFRTDNRAKELIKMAIYRLDMDDRRNVAQSSRPLPPKELADSNNNNSNSNGTSSGGGLPTSSSSSSSTTSSTSTSTSSPITDHSVLPWLASVLKRSYSNTYAKFKSP